MFQQYSHTSRLFLNTLSGTSLSVRRLHKHTDMLTQTDRHTQTDRRSLRNDEIDCRMIRSE